MSADREQTEPAPAVPACSSLGPIDAAAAYPGFGPAACFTLLGFGLSVCMALLSDGVYHDDDLTHLQIARWSWDWPTYLLHDWGRPGFTAVYALPARAGWLAARIFSGALTAATAWLAYLIAARQGIRLAALVPILLWIQPLTFTLSYTTLTETPLAFCLTLAAWLYLRGRYGWSAAAISLAAVTRHEAVLFPVIWLGVLLFRRRPLGEWIWVLWAPVLQNVLASIFLDKTPLLLYFDAKPTEEFGHGTWLTMLTRWPVAAGVGPLLLALAGAPSTFRRQGGALWIGCGLTYFLAHAAIYRFGLFASGGYARFLVPIGPVIAVAAAEGLSRTWVALRQVPPYGIARRRINRRRALLMPLGGVLLLWVAAEVEIARHWDTLVRYHTQWTVMVLRVGAGMLGGVCVVGLALSGSRSRPGRFVALGAFPLIMLLMTALQPLVVAHIPRPLTQCAPLMLSERELAYREAAAWLREQGLAQRVVLSPSPWFDEFLGRSRPPAGPSTAARFEAMQPGEILLWDSREAASPRHGLLLARLRRRSDFVERWHSGGGPYDGLYCSIFEKLPPPGTQPEP